MTAIEKPEDSEKVQRVEVLLPEETLAAFGGDELRSRVFYEKYALRDASGKQVETTPDKLWLRVARELASVEEGEKKQEWTDKFYWLLEDFKFVPGGRIMFGAGQSRRATLLNCYFFKIKEDSIEAIFEWCKEAARTYSFGGGVGTDISVLRPRGSPANFHLPAVFSNVASGLAGKGWPSMTTRSSGFPALSVKRATLWVVASRSAPAILESICARSYCCSS